LQIRLMKDEDLEAVVRVWHTAGRMAYTPIESRQRCTLDQARSVFRHQIAPVCEVWVAETEVEIVGYLALKGSYIDRLYVSPNHQRHGVGTALLKCAMECSPAGLELHTHQKNTQARTFYEKHEFVPVKYGISPPPENTPDVEYHWRPHLRFGENVKGLG
jgi:ribosomal protein S18 acetylase RimI-like enzyme